MHMGYNDERRFPDFSFVSKSGNLTQLIDCVIITHLYPKRDKFISLEIELLLFFLLKIIVIWIIVELYLISPKCVVMTDQ